MKLNLTERRASPAGMPYEGSARDRSQRHLLTVVTNLVARAIGLGAVFVSLHVALPFLGSERFGVLATVSGLTAVLTFMDLGIGNSLVSKVARLRAANELERLRRLISDAFTVLALIGILAFIGMATLSPLIDPAHFFRGLAVESYPEARQCVFVFILLFSASIPLGAAPRIFSGLQEGYTSNIVSSIISAAAVAILWQLPHAGSGAPLFLLVTFGGQLVSGLILMMVLWRRNLIGRLRVPLPQLPEIRELLGVSRHYLVLQVGGLAGWGADGLILSSTLGAASVAQYAVVQRLFSLVAIPASILNAPLWPAYADADARGDVNYIRRTLRRSMLVTGAFALIGAGFFTVTAPVLLHVLTKHAIEVPRALVLNYGIWTICDVMGTAFAMYMNGRHIIRPQVFVTIPFVFISLALKLFIVPRLGIVWLPALTAAAYIVAIALPYSTIFRATLRLPSALANDHDASKTDQRNHNVTPQDPRREVGA
jgi:O-antigen/teichoic acid export membrane protein